MCISTTIICIFKKKISPLSCQDQKLFLMTQKKSILHRILTTFISDCIFIQETKMTSKGHINNLHEYQIFEHVRKDSKGGGILTAVKKCFNPVLIYEGNDDIELLVVQAKVKNNQIRFINGYGPQENDNKVLGFYQKLEEKI